MLVILSTHPVQYQVPLWQALGAQSRVPFEVWYLTDQGTRVTHDREFGQSFKWDLDTLQGYTHKFLETAEGASPGAFWKCRLREDLRSRLRSSGATALWIQGWQVAAYWQAAWLARDAGVKLWLRGESNYLKRDAGWKRPVKRSVLGRLFERVDQFLCIGTANRKLYEGYGVPAGKLHDAPYFVDNERFARQAEALRPTRSAIRASWGIPEDAFCVMFCGKFIAKKHPLDLVAAAARLMRGGLPNIHLLFAGSGALGGELRAACSVAFDAEAQSPGSRRGGLPPASFTGFMNQTQVSAAYVAADCLVLPSDEGETWGLVVNEALASGLPAIASNSCGCTEDLIAPYDPALKFDVGDIDGIARAILHVASGPRRPAQDALRIHSVGHTVETVTELYLSGRSS